MDVICVVCGHKPESGEYIVRLEKLFYDKGTRQKGESVMICADHCPQDIYQALDCGGKVYRKRVDNRRSNLIGW